MKKVGLPFNGGGHTTQLRSVTSDPCMWIPSGLRSSQTAGGGIYLLYPRPFKHLGMNVIELQVKINYTVIDLKKMHQRFDTT